MFNEGIFLRAKEEAGANHRSEPEASAEEGDTLSPPLMLGSKEDLAAFYLNYYIVNKFFQTDGDLPEHLAKKNIERRQKLAEKNAEKALKEIEEKGAMRFFGIKDGDQLVATGMVEITEAESGEKYGWLKGHTVNPEYRGRGLAGQITEESINFSRNEGCDYVMAEVYTGNPAALKTKLKGGFVVSNFEFYDPEDTNKGRFIMIKSTDKKQKRKKYKNQQTIDVSDFSNIKKLIDQGWVGTGLDQQSLIMEK